MTLRFSVVIPLYNKVAYIRRAVDSVLAQSYRDFELIVVDDGSTDGSHLALDPIDDPRFRLVRQKNAGEGAARNRGIEEAREAWVAFLDADDLWLPTHLEETAAIIEAIPEAGFVATGLREVLETTIAGRDISDLAAHYSNRDKRPDIRRVDYFLETSRRIGRVSSSNVAVRRDELIAIGGFGAFRAGADLDCWARLALRRPCALSDRMTCLYVRGTGGVMENFAPPQRVSQGQSLAPPLRDISASVGSLCRAIDADPTLALRPGIHAYLNSRVYSCIYGRLYRNDVGAAIAYASLLRPPYSLKISAMRALLSLPEAWIYFVLSLRRRAKLLLQR